MKDRGEEWEVIPQKKMSNPFESSFMVAGLKMEICFEFELPLIIIIVSNV